MSEFSAGKDQGLILGELKAIRESIGKIETGFYEFKRDAEERVGNTEKDLAKLKDQVSMLITVGKWVLSPALAALTTAVGGIMAHKLLKFG